MKRHAFFRELYPKIKRQKLTHLSQEAAVECACCITECNARNPQVKCQYGCGYQVCQKCTYTYLMSKLELSHCMNCKKEWSALFTDSFLTAEQTKLYRKQQQTLLINQEKSILPEAQFIIEERGRASELRDQMIQLQRELNRCTKKLKQIVTHERLALTGQTSVEPPKSRELFKCPLKDCRGFVNIKSHICGLCNKTICKVCYHENILPHTCMPTDVENVKYLKKYTKRCPNCGMSTSKTEGCNQMWCTQCKKTWNWQTGQLEKENVVIHNPHYFEWQRQTKGSVERNPQDIPCGGLPRWFPENLLPNEYYLIFFNFLRLTHHFRETTVEPRQPLTLDLRLQYLSGKLNEVQWGRTLMQRRKRYLAEREFFQLDSMFALAATDIIHRLLNPQTKISADQYLTEMRNLREYYNCQISIYASRHHRTRFYLIDQNFQTLNADEATPAMILSIQEKINLLEVES